MTLILIYVTHPSEEHADKIVKHLLEKRLIACAGSFPQKSSYWWKGKIENSKETVTLLKAPDRNWTRIKEEIEKMHEYDTPCIIRFGAEANSKYARWLDEETRTKKKS
jgi:periplasmic divalent cation tolerance protein